VNISSSGQEDGKESLILFNQWVERMTDADFRAIERGGELNRSESVKETGFGQSFLNRTEASRSPILPRETGRITTLASRLIGQVQP